MSESASSPTSAQEALPSAIPSPSVISPSTSGSSPSPPALFYPPPKTSPVPLPPNNVSSPPPPQDLSPPPNKSPPTPLPPVPQSIPVPSPPPSPQSHSTPPASNGYPPADPVLSPPPAPKKPILSPPAEQGHHRLNKLRHQLLQLQTQILQILPFLLLSRHLFPRILLLRPLKGKPSGYTPSALPDVPRNGQGNPPSANGPSSGPVSSSHHVSSSDGLHQRNVNEGNNSPAVPRIVSRSPFSPAVVTSHGSHGGYGCPAGTPEAAGSGPLFSYEELMGITNGFSLENKIGEGGFGAVYRGSLPDGKLVAIKQLKVGSGQGEREFRAEVADFGLAKLANDASTHVSTRVVGTFGYMAPEYAASGKLTDKSDARPLLVQALETGNCAEIVDPRLENCFPEADMLKMIEVAASCVRHSAVKRPRMAQVLRALEDKRGTSDLSNGVKVGESVVYDSAKYSADIHRFQRLAFASHDLSSELGTWAEHEQVSPASSRRSLGDASVPSSLV
ncbi:hypothetical protein HPP92_023404 [Vanilla planifolia]|uniref:non-specific serine/threonine protein kinase n=1 Tax=Vanilla planifolia TaxID=51239 RepID=A0A835PYF4_VANPL|nr:hypothetical protein HPP92_023404 [Vanilla planifolia]